LGKSAPTPPPAPDPATIINAQTGASEQTAQFQSGLNNVNYQGPQGDVSYSMQSPGRWTENVQLNPTEQATYDTVDNANYRAAKVADNQILNVGKALENPAPAIPQLQTGVSAVSPFVTYGGAGATSPLPGDPSSAPAGMRYDQSSGWIPTTPYGVDATGAHPGQMYDPNQGWVAATGQAAYPSSGQPTSAASPQSGALALSGAAASNPVAATQLATYQNARQMLDPQWRQASEQQQARLVAQGLNPDSAAYQNAQTLFGDQENEAYDAALYNAITAGDAEQQALYGQNLSSAQLGNQAAQQTFQNQAYATQLPIDEFTALLGDSQVAMPPSSPAQNTPVQPANALGAYQLQQNALQSDYQAQLQNSQSGLTGLFNLGAAALKTFGVPL
jgi:hypothetical protein